MPDPPKDATGDRAPEPVGSGASARVPLRFGELVAANASGQTRETARSASLAVIAHVLIILLVIWAGSRGVLEPTADIGVGDGIGAGLAGGGGGGGSGDEQITYFRIPEAEPPAPTVEQLVTVPVPAVEVPPPEVKPADIPTPSPVAVGSVLAPDAGSGTGTGTGEGAGTGAGQGPGSGGGSGGGDGGGIGSGTGPGSGKGQIMAPSPTVILVPPAASRKVKGKTIVVRLAVDSTGIVRDVDLVPPSGDRGYDNKLRQVAMGWKFRPARGPDNRPVAVVFDVEFTF